MGLRKLYESEDPEILSNGGPKSGQTPSHGRSQLLPRVMASHSHIESIRRHLFRLLKRDLPDIPGLDVQQCQPEQMRGPATRF